MRPLAVAATVWFSLTIIAAICGGVLSMFTGKAGNLPQWNGWPYFIFCTKEGMLFGQLIAFPAAILALVVAWIISRK